MSNIQERKQRILEEIKHQQKVQISDLSAIIDEFGVSEKTIARDLSQLIEEKLVEKE
ncbi:MAG: DeoR family transcriptional regulator [Candidatus Peribacteria bacterium]|nr:MAG: DeoR family transcriptional regulator [Candidatus Peribacteria bacterium]